MADEATVPNPSTEANVEEGSIASIEVPVESKAKAPETVPLSVFLAIKDELKDLKQTIKDNPVSAAQASATVNSVAEQFPDVSKDFIAAIVSATKNETAQELEQKYSPILERQKQQEFDTAFDKLFNKALEANPDAKNVDKDVIKALALTPAYNNVPLVDIIQKLYPVGTPGRVTTENDARATADVEMDNIDVTKLTDEQRDKILDNPKQRAEYYAKLDALGM